MNKPHWNKKLKSIAWLARQFRPLPMVSIVIFVAGVILFTPLDMETSDKETYSQTAWRPVKPLVRAHLRKAVNKPPGLQQLTRSIMKIVTSFY